MSIHLGIKEADVARRSSPVRQQEIAEAVIEIISSEGLRALSMPAVARRIGVVPSALYRHYSGKDAMVEAAVQRLGQRIGAMVDAAEADGSSALEMCGGLVNGFKALMPQPTAIPQVVFGLPAESSQRMRRLVDQMVAETVRRIAAILEQGQRRGELRQDFDPAVAATSLWGIFVTTALRWYLARGEFDMDTYIDEAWALYRCAIAADEA
jgi:AcrR family transcriptional regulator